MNPDTIKEKLIEDYPIPITAEGTDIILSQMRKSICKIYMDNGIKGTGFFCRTTSPDKNNLVKFLVTNNHIIDELHLAKNSCINITINNDTVKKQLIIGDRKVYTSKKYDTTIIEIFEDENIINDYLDFDFDLKGEILNNIYIGKSIYILHYPKYEKVSVSYGVIKSIDLSKNYDIYHLCCTDKGSSGSPILNILTNKIIGIHKGTVNNQNYNKGTILYYPLKEYFSQISKKMVIKPLKMQIKNTMKDFIFKPSLGGHSYNRVRKEIEDSKHNQNEGYQLFKFIGDKLYGVLEGPPNTYYENGFLHFVMIYDNGYPFKPPKFYFQTKMFHPNIDEFGLVCLDFYAHPAYTVDKIILSVQALLDSPNMNEVLNEYSANLYQENKKEYENTVRKYTSQYANFETTQKELQKIDCKIELND